MVTELDRAAEALHPRPAARRPARRRLPRRGDRRDRRHERRPLGGRPARRHHQLPLRPPGLQRVDRRRGRRRGSVAGVVVDPLARRHVHRRPRRRRAAATAQPIALLDQPTTSPRRPVRHRLRLRPRPPAPAGRGARRRSSPASATSAGWARPPSTSARWRAAGSTPTGSGASARGTSPPAASSPREAGRRSSTRRRPALGFVLAAPPALFDALRDLLVGFRRGARPDRHPIATVRTRDVRGARARVSAMSPTVDPGVAPGRSASSTRRRHRSRSPCDGRLDANAGVELLAALQARARRRRRPGRHRPPRPSTTGAPKGPGPCAAAGGWPGASPTACTTAPAPAPATTPCSTPSPTTTTTPSARRASR